MAVLVINCGSSSLKYAVFKNDETLLTSGKHERLVQDADAGVSHAEAVATVLRECERYDIECVGHRVVHGGALYHRPQLIDATVLKAIEQYIPAAPMHNPYSLAAIIAAQEALPTVPQIAVFDTSFHARMPRRASTYAIDYDVAQKHGIRRFGFHGISHEYAANVAATYLERPLDELRLITMHLGNGASACAVEYGCSTETSMGNTPLEGLVMGTRSGDVDAGVILNLLRTGEYDADSLNTLLNHQSGLAGLSGLGNDLREIEAAAAAGHDRARLAINVFAHRARKYIGAYAAAMGGVDAIAFTGGIGENSASMRRRILQRLEFLGVMINEDANYDASIQNDNDHAVISTNNSRVDVIVVKTNEELMIARESLLVTRPKSSELPPIPIAVSARHCHLTAETFATLFGADATPTLIKDLYQPGQYACAEKVTLVGPRNRIENVRLLGPLRSVDQVEIARTDEFKLGVDAPVRNSGQVKDSASITIEGPAGTVHLKEGLICARRHIHMHSDDAELYGVKDKEQVSVAVMGGERDLIFGDVLVRVKDSYKLEMHIDTDEGNAAELTPGTGGSINPIDLDEMDSTDQQIDTDDVYISVGLGKAQLQ
ncbi:acetate/propionate family kinase [Granulosicoccus sp.]|nr:acetate/propionate family kinase [Granulosicoccus sp.]MDB4223749.1 acetate/propionate family kinase [Granulosicoccus sp.]